MKQIGLNFKGAGGELRQLGGIILLIAAICLAGGSFAADKLVIGTGGKSGFYYQVGKLLCLSVRSEKRHLKCKYKATKGSPANLPDLRRGKFDVVVANSFWGYEALKGVGHFAGKGPDKNLRALFSFHPEPITIIARKDAGIHRIQDLKGKRVNVGLPGYGLERQFNQLLQAMGWRRSDFETLGDLDTKAQISALCENRMDAVMYSVGHPSSYVWQALKKCPTVLVEVAGPQIDRLVRKNSYLRKTEIPAKLYKQVSTDIKTYGEGAVLYTRADVPKAVIYTLVKGVFENLDRIRKAGGPVKNLKVSEMIHDSLSAPLHLGALRYYREQGWMK